MASMTSCPEEYRNLGILQGTEDKLMILVAIEAGDVDYIKFFF